MNDVRIEPVGNKKRVEPAKDIAVSFDSHSVPFSPDVVIQESSSSKKIDLRPKIPAPSSIGCNPMLNLVNFVTSLDKLKGELLEDNREQIIHLSKQLQSHRKSLLDAEKESVKAEEKAHFSRLLKNLALFTTSTVSFLFTGTWSQATLGEKLLKGSTLALSTTSLMAHAFDGFDLVDERFKNALLSLNIIALAGSTIYHMSSMATLPSPAEKFANLASQITSGVSQIDEGYRKRQAALLNKIASEQSEKVKQQQTRLTETFDENRHEQERLAIEAQVAEILKNYQDAIANIQNTTKG